ncbi:MAG TPA: glycosyltransferase family 4 protein [Anaerolineales bacterium]|nr:glycosyltransferase family 4 protein [Anaerolineales bacterium]
MRIGLVIYGSLDTLSGGYLYDRKLVEYLRERGDVVEIISIPWRNYAAHLTDNLHFRLPTNLDILIQDELNHPSLIAANAPNHPYPIISLVHHLRCSESRPGWQNAMYRLIEKKYLKSVDAFIFNSKTTQQVVHQLIGNRKLNIVAHPPTDRFGEAISKEEIESRAQRNPLRILFLGNLIERKGLHTLLEAIRFQPLLMRLDIVGSLNSEPAYTKQIREYVAANKLSSFVSFHGLLDNETLTERLKQAQVLVVPSSYEGYGIVYLEGMCFGLPAIGTTAGAAGEIISDGINGFLIRPGDAATLANRIKALNKNRDTLIRMSLAARERYIRQPKWEQTAGQIRQFLLKQI